MALGAGDAPKAAVKVAARGEVGDRARAVEPVERAEEGERGDGAVEEARVRLAKGVARKDARGLLQAQNDCVIHPPSGYIRRKEGWGWDEQSTRRGMLSRERASCVARTWIALSVERMCASWPGCAPNAPFGAWNKLLCYCGAHAGEEGKGREVVGRRFVRTCVVIPAAHHILYRLLRIQRVLVLHYA